MYPNARIGAANSNLRRSNSTLNFLLNSSAICFAGIAPNSRPSSPAFALIVTTVSSRSKNSLISLAFANNSALCFSSAFFCPDKVAKFAAFASLAKPFLIRKFCAYPSATSVSYTHLDVYKRQLQDGVISNGKGLSLQLPEAKRKLLEDKGYNGKELIFGIRPEDIESSQIAIDTLSLIHI